MSSSEQIWEPVDSLDEALGEAVSLLLYRHGGPLEVSLFVDEFFGPLAINIRDLLDGSRVVVSSAGDRRIVDIKNM